MIFYNIHQYPTIIILYNIRSSRVRFFRAQHLVWQGTSRPQTTSTLVDGTATCAESWFISVQLSRSLLSPGLFGLLPACNLRGTGARPMSSVIHQEIGDSIAMVLSNCFKFKAEIFRSSGLVPAHWEGPGRILLPVAIRTIRSDATRAKWMDSETPLFFHVFPTLHGHSLGVLPCRIKYYI